jgi:hypothetical protein
MKFKRIPTKKFFLMKNDENIITFITRFFGVIKSNEILKGVH